MGSYLQITFSDDVNKIIKFEKKLPFACSELFTTDIKSVQCLTTGNDVNTVYDICLNTKDISYEFNVGDAIGILPCNDMNEVEKIFNRLDINGDTYYMLTISATTTKKKATIPQHIPAQGTLRDVFKRHVDIRSVPKKLFLKALVEHTIDEQEKSFLNTIIDRNHSEQYNQFINGPGRTLISILDHLPSCRPPVEVLLEHLPPLQPRYYSISSSPLNPDEIHITFSVIVCGEYKGVCSGWLESCVTAGKRYISFYFRTSSGFLKIPDDTKPVVMIGPGTGVAPFIGYLQHRHLQKKDYGETTLYFGCRYSDRDYLYKTDTERYLDLNVLSKQYLSFSREGDKKMYVQDNIVKNGEELVQQIVFNGGTVCICGDLKQMACDVEKAICSVLIKYNCMEKDEAERYVEQMKKDNRFQLDIWI